MNKLLIFDTTLRDGEQMPGVHLSRAHKIEIARQLERMKVDVIEAGFPASSKGDFMCVKEIAAVLKNCAVAGLSRADRGDIDTAWEALKEAESPRIHTFIATSELHMKYKLKLSRDEVLRRVADSVSYAAGLCSDVEFSAEDASRSDVEFLTKVIETAIKAGARTINIPDTVGYAMPEQFGELVRGIIERTDTGNVIFSVHCHDDLGCATANTLSAIKAGARQAEVTVNGVGERAGNTSAEEVIMSLNTRADFYGIKSEADTKQIVRTSRLVSSLFGISVPPNKAIVGGNAFSHEAGIHQHGMMADSRTYEIMTPETVGLSSSNLVLGKLSGRHAFEKRLKELGYTIEGKDAEACFEKFKLVADKKETSDEDIMAIVNEYLDGLSGKYKLETFQIQSGNSVRSMAMVTLSCRGVSLSEAALGDGPIDAAFNAINRLSGAVEIKLEEYGIKAVTEGADALGEATVSVTIDGARYSGRSVSIDIIAASIKAYVNALNKWARE